MTSTCSPRIAGATGDISLADGFDTEVFFVVDESERGPIDTPAALEFQTLVGRVYYKNFHAGMNLFREKRNNGTQLQENDSRIYLFETGVETSSWELNFYSQNTQFNSSFSRILPDRSAEFLTVAQSFPTLGWGASAAFRPSAGLQAGVDWRYVSWEDRGQNLAGLFIQDLLSVRPKLDVLVGGRVDVWENQQTQTTFNPRAGVLYRASDAFTLRSSVYRGFRAPTLNELYRPFRVGNVETLANPDLNEEHLRGLEAGVDFHPSKTLLLRLNGYRSSLRDAVANVTLSVSPEGILRQRQNLGRATIQGLEAEATYFWGGVWQAHTSYLYSDARVDDTGLRLAQVPLHQGSAGIDYVGPVRASVYGRLVGEQFEDDRNELPLSGYGVIDLFFQVPVSRTVDLFVGVENVTDVSYPVGRTPVEQLGTPRLIHGGLLLRLR